MWWTSIINWFANLFPSTEWVLKGTHGGRSVAVAANRKFGAAIYSLKWGGVELLDSADHGRELQTAWQLNGHGEGENPTEAGAGSDTTSSSTKIISASVTNDTTLTTSVNPAYWFKYNNQMTSPHKLSKNVTLGHQGLSNVLRHQITIELASPQTKMAVEGITGYTAAILNRAYNLENGVAKEVPLPAIFGDCPNPPILASADGKYAIGGLHRTAGYRYDVGFIPNMPLGKFDAAWFFVEQAATGGHSYEVFTIFGTLDDVVRSMNLLKT